MKNGKFPICEYIEMLTWVVVNAPAFLYNNFLVVNQQSFTQPLLCVRHWRELWGEMDGKQSHSV